MTGPLRATTHDSPVRRDDFDITRYLYGTTALFGAATNVILQLSAAPVGYGVVESTVDSGKIMLHPIKRTRTTLTYLVVALLGDETERAAYREAVNRSHRRVRSGPSSPVRYNAFDPRLQLWVAACLYWGARDLYERMHGRMSEADADAFYTHCARFGTTLQMPPALWPPDRKAFDEYWAATLASATLDPPVRAHLLELVDLRMFPRPIQLSCAGFHRWLVAGLLPPDLRARLGMTWTDRDDRRLALLLRAVGAVEERIPQRLRLFPMHILLTDLRLRRQLGLRPV
ncbi:oxygenase MpaB family protein [Nocardia sp. NPDC004068]|uniref:oxygenase MpaB family protein n=1 Tax=Nocardia sp. NPDC004068 TaxID=3364303 RepID=UPI0036C36DB1